MSQRLSKCVVTQNQCPPPHPRCVFGDIIFWLLACTWLGRSSACVLPPLLSLVLRLPAQGTISIPFSLSSPSGTPIMCRLLLWMLSHSSHRFFHAFFILFSSLSSGWLVSIFLSSASKILLLLLMLSVAFSILLRFMHCNLKKEFLFDSFSFSASLHSFRDLSSLTRTESRHSSERIES